MPEEAEVRAIVRSGLDWWLGALEAHANGATLMVVDGEGQAVEGIETTTASFFAIAPQYRHVLEDVLEADDASI